MTVFILILEAPVKDATENCRSGDQTDAPHRDNEIEPVRYLVNSISVPLLHLQSQDCDGYHLEETQADLGVGGCDLQDHEG